MKIFEYNSISRFRIIGKKKISQITRRVYFCFVHLYARETVNEALA